MPFKQLQLKNNCNKLCSSQNDYFISKLKNQTLNNDLRWFIFIFFIFYFSFIHSTTDATSIFNGSEIKQSVVGIVATDNWELWMNVWCIELFNGAFFVHLKKNKIEKRIKIKISIVTNIEILDITIFLKFYDTSLQ